MILAIDPGDSESAYVLLDGDRLIEFGKIENDALLARLPYMRGLADEMAIEMIASYGMPVGREVFDTCVFIGRAIQAWSGRHSLVYRKDVRMHLCNDGRKATDATVRQALIDRFGPGKDKAIGKKKTPGPLFGVSKDVWSALAVAVTHADSAVSS